MFVEEKIMKRSTIKNLSQNNYLNTGRSMTQALHKLQYRSNYSQFITSLFK